MGDQGQIRIIPGRIIDSTNNRIIFNEGGSDLIASVTPGTYWCGENATLVAGGYADLYGAIETAMTAAGSNSYEVRAATPTESSQQEAKGLSVRSQISGLPWTLKPTSGSWTFPLELLGLADNAAYSAVDIASVNVGSFEVVTSPMVRGGEWFSWNIYKDNGTDRQTSYQKYREVSSNEDPLIAYAYTWLDQDSSPDRRRVVVHEVPGAHVWGYRTLKPSYASTGKMADGDINNGFVEMVWSYARTLRGAGVNASDLIIAYDGDWPADGAGISISDGYDVGRILKRADRESPLSILTEIRPNGEFYSLNIELALKTKGYLQ